MYIFLWLIWLTRYKKDKIKPRVRNIQKYKRSNVADKRSARKRTDPTFIMLQERPTQ